MRGLQLSVFAALGLAAGQLCAAQPGDVALDAEKAAKVKAAYLYNFAKFTQWPDHAFADAGAPLVFGVVGDERFSDTLRATVQGKAVNDRPVSVRRFAPQSVDDAELRKCHVVFVSQSARERWEAVRTRLGDAPVLVVGEGDDFVRQGGMIGFVVAEGHVVFHINNDEVRRAGLQLSSKLLTLAKAVYGKSDE